MAGQFYNDIDFFLKPGIDSDLSLLEDSEAVKTSVKNIVLTMKREKLFDPKFGTIIRRLLFSLLNFALVFRIQRQVEFALYSREPRIRDIRVNVRFYAEQHTLYVNVNYTIIGLQQRISQDILLSRVR